VATLAVGALASIGGILNAIIFATPRLLFAIAAHINQPTWKPMSGPNAVRV
jgi:hypothetical protein